MSLKKIAVAAMFGMSAMTISASALAQRAAETGWYVGASIGKNDDFDDEMAWKITGGYQINRNLAAELSYTKLGEASVLGTNIEASAWELIGLYKFPLANKFSVYGLAGLARLESEAVLPIIGKQSDTSTEFTYGIGVQYDFSTNVGVRAQWQNYDDSGVISLGVVYKF